MSVIHVNQIRNQIEKLFTGLIDLSDVSKASEGMKQDFFLTRGLAAYAVHFLSGAPPSESATAVTDGGDDNGIDALFFHEPSKRLYFVQSKWIKDGIGEPENGDVKKFVAGVRDLINMKLERFNSKIQSKSSVVAQALNDPATRYEVVLAYTGSSVLATPSERDLRDLADEMNDVSEVLATSILNQSKLHASLTIGVTGEPINLPIGLKFWGRKESPHEAIYGQVSAEQIADWWNTYRTRLFAGNLRSMLGETEVNVEMRQTLEKRPEQFWYFNNGVTIVARKASRAMAGGTGTDFGTFHCEDVSIVNGAQTVGTIGKYADGNAKAVEQAFVSLRIIVRGDNQYFGEEVTRTNNRQNRIENRDFVSLDPEQARIRMELAIDGIEYQLARSEVIVRGEKAFDLVEATTALACASGTIRLPVQLKREIGKLWDDTARAPYKELFNPSVPGLHAWRCVQVQRRIDHALDTYVARTKFVRHSGVTTHGNRLIAALVFEKLPVAQFRQPVCDLDGVASQEIINTLVDTHVAFLALMQDKFYPNAMIPTLFKNLSKCEDLATKARKMSEKADEIAGRHSKT
jgi:hypothetical protein